MSPANPTATPRGARIRPSMLAVAIAASAASGPILAPRPAAAQSVVVSGGAVQSNGTPTTYDSLEIYGTDGVGNPSTYDADAALTLTGNLSVHDLGVLNADAAIVGQGWLYLARGGVINRSSASISVQGFTIDDATLGILAGDSFNPPYPWWNSDVSNGGVANVATGAVLPGMQVYGTNGSSARSTLNIDGDVTVNGDVSASSSGRVNLNAGTMDATGHSLSFSGVGSVNQSGGHYSAGNLTLYQGATITYAPADSITGAVAVYNGSVMTLGKDLSLTGNLTIDGATSSLATSGHAYSVANLNLTNGAALSYGAGDAIAQTVSVSNNATLTLDQNLSLPGWLNLYGGSISRTSQTISAQGFTASNTTLDLLASDSFNPPYPWWDSDVSDGAVVNAATGVVLPGMQVSGTNGSSARSTLNIDGDVTVNGDVSASSSGRVNLNAGTMDATGHSLSFSGVGSVNQSGGHYSATNLTLNQGATITYAPADSITAQVLVSNGSVMTLGRDLSLAGRLGLSYGGSISRSSETISALYFDVYGATLDLVAGDTFDTAYGNSITYGGVVNAPAGTVLGYVQVYGVDGSSAPATFNVNGNTSVTGLQTFSGGVVDLDAGTLTVGSLVLSGAGSILQHGGHYAATSLSLSNAATLAYGAGDSIGSLWISDAGSELDELSPLTLTSLSISNGGLLRLASFTGTGAVSNWGLRWGGDHTSYLETLIAGNLLTGGSSPLSVFFDAGSGFTYVTSDASAVPEVDPASAGGAWALLVGTLGLLERRKRRA